MIDEETRRKLREMNLGELVEAIDVQEQQSGISTVPFCDRVKMLVDYAYQEKYNKKVERLLVSARLRYPQADMSGILYEGRGIDRSQFIELGTCQYAKSCKSVVLQGFTGSGKTYLACALGKQACLAQIKTRYIRLPDMLAEYDESSLVHGRSKKTIDKYAGIPLLIIDEWLVDEVSAKERHFLFELMERRSDSTSTIFCTQYKKENWVKRLGEDTQAEAIVDRFAYTALWIETGSMNMREYMAQIDQS